MSIIRIEKKLKIFIFFSFFADFGRKYRDFSGFLAEKIA